MDHTTPIQSNKRVKLEGAVHHMSCIKEKGKKNKNKKGERICSPLCRVLRDSPIPSPWLGSNSQHRPARKRHDKGSRRSITILWRNTEDRTEGKCHERHFGSQKSVSGCLPMFSFCGLTATCTGIHMASDGRPQETKSKH